MPKDTTPGKPTTRRYSPEEKAAAVRMVRTLRAELGTEHGTVHRVAAQLAYGTESVRSWVRQADIDEGQVPGVSTSEAARLKELEQENPELKRANEILKRAASFFGSRSSTASTRSSRVHRRQPRRCRRWPAFGGRTHLLCVAGGPEKLLRDQEPSALGPVVQQLWEGNYRLHGARRIWKAPQRAGYDVGRDQVARLMRGRWDRGCPAHQAGTHHEDRPGRAPTS